MIISIIISSSKQVDSKVVFDYYGIIYNKTNVKWKCRRTAKTRAPTNLSSKPNLPSHTCARKMLILRPGWPWKAKLTSYSHIWRKKANALEICYWKKIQKTKINSQRANYLEVSALYNCIYLENCTQNDTGSDVERTQTRQKPKRSQQRQPRRDIESNMVKHHPRNRALQK